MRVGDLVKVKLTHGRDPVIGLIVEVKQDEHNTVALVKPIDSEPNRLIYANPLDVEVINESR